MKNFIIETKNEKTGEILRQIDTESLLKEIVMVVKNGMILERYLNDSCFGISVLKTFYDDSLLIKINNKFLLIEKEGNYFFQYNGIVVFDDIWRYNDGITKIKTSNEIYCFRLINKDGSLFKCPKGHTEFSWVNRENGLVFFKRNDAFYVAKKDNTLFDYKGKTIFSKISSSNRPVRTNLYVGEDKKILIEDDGSVFNYNGIEEFYYIEREYKGFTKIKINEGDKFLLIKKDGTVYSREITITVDEFDNILLYRGDVISYNTINGKEYVF